VFYPTSPRFEFRHPLLSQVDVGNTKRAEEGSGNRRNWPLGPAARPFQGGKHGDLHPACRVHRQDLTTTSIRSSKIFADPFRLRRPPLKREDLTIEAFFCGRHQILTSRHVIGRHVTSSGSQPLSDAKCRGSLSLTDTVSKVRLVFLRPALQGQPGPVTARFRYRGPWRRTSTWAGRTNGCGVTYPHRSRPCSQVSWASAFASCDIKLQVPKLLTLTQRGKMNSMFNKCPFQHVHTKNTRRLSVGFFVSRAFLYIKLDPVGFAQACGKQYRCSLMRDAQLASFESCGC